MQEKRNPNGQHQNISEVCPECGGTEFRTELKEQKFLYGREGEESELCATVPVFTCGSCGFEFTGEAAEEARLEAVCRHLKLMTPSDIRAIRKSHDMTRLEFAELSRIGIASLARWENGILLQNGANDQLLYLLQFDHNIALLRSREMLSQPQPITQYNESQIAEMNGTSPDREDRMDRLRVRRCPIRGRFRRIDRPDERRAAASGWRP
jgi:DNA-binding transcriptional regulator YiaG